MVTESRKKKLLVPFYQHYLYISDWFRQIEVFHTHSTLTHPLGHTFIGLPLFGSPHLGMVDLGMVLFTMAWLPSDPGRSQSGKVGQYYFFIFLDTVLASGWSACKCSFALPTAVLVVEELAELQRHQCSESRSQAACCDFC